MKKTTTKKVEIKKLPKAVKVDDKGLVAAIGKKVFIFGLRYNYCGTLVDVNKNFIFLDDAKLVLDTGDFKNGMSKFSNAEVPYNKQLYVGIGVIESWVIQPWVIFWTLSNPQGSFFMKKIPSYSDICECKTQNNALKMFNKLLDSLVLQNGGKKEDYVQTQLSNIGYIAGYYDEETRKKVLKWLNAQHPIFGNPK